MRPTPTSEIRALVEALGAADAIKREAAIGRLAVIGRRAVDRLATIFADPSTSREKKIAILRVLEATRDPRGVAIARSALQDGGDVAVTATATLHAHLDIPDAAGATAALDALVATAVDRDAERRVRLAAFDALQEMPGDVRKRIAAALQDDLDAGAASSPPQRAAEAIWRDAVDGRLPDDPAPLRDIVQAGAASAALSSLQKLVEATKKREMDSRTSSRAEEWRAVRGAIHQALALRGSSVALYDLRETLEHAPRALPASYLSALHLIGDETCLQPIAAAFSRSDADERWRSQLAAAFNAIVKRQRIPRTSGTLERIRSRWPEFARIVNTPSRTTARRKKAGRT